LNELKSRKFSKKMVFENIVNTCFDKYIIYNKFSILLSRQICYQFANILIGGP
jgi:hypothetical protein